MQFNQILARLLGDPIHIRVFRILHRHPEGMSGRALALLAETSPFKINQVLRYLVSQGVLTQKAVGRANIYQLNPHHIFVTDVAQKLLEFEDGIFSRMGKRIMQTLKPKPIAILLYGSIARGEETPQSDIDLMIVYKDGIEAGKIPATGDIVLELLNRIYGNPASIRRAFVSDIQQPIREHQELIRNIIKEGKSIAGLSMTELLNYRG